MTKLTSAQISEALTTLPGWSLDAGELTRTFVFADFPPAVSFVNDVARVAEKANHHPDIDIRYNKVRLAVTTHDAGGITAADVAMATTINATRGDENQAA